MMITKVSYLPTYLPTYLSTYLPTYLPTSDLTLRETQLLLDDGDNDYDITKIRSDFDPYPNLTLTHQP